MSAGISLWRACKECVLVNRANSLCSACSLVLCVVPLPAWSLTSPVSCQGHHSLQKAGSPWDVSGDKDEDLPLRGGPGAQPLWPQSSCNSSAVSLQPDTCPCRDSAPTALWQPAKSIAAQRCCGLSSHSTSCQHIPRSSGSGSDAVCLAGALCSLLL